MGREHSIPRMIGLIVCAYSNLLVMGLWYSIPRMIGPIVRWHSNRMVEGLGYSNLMVDRTHSILFMIICVWMWVWVFWEDSLSSRDYSFKFIVSGTSGDRGKAKA